MKEPFEKTATQKIRRFKYKESAPTVEEEQRNKYLRWKNHLKYYILKQFFYLSSFKTII